MAHSLVNEWYKSRGLGESSVLRTMHHGDSRNCKLMYTWSQVKVKNEQS